MTILNFMCDVVFFYSIQSNETLCLCDITHIFRLLIWTFDFKFDVHLYQRFSKCDTLTHRQYIKSFQEVCEESVYQQRNGVEQVNDMVKRFFVFYCFKNKNKISLNVEDNLLLILTKLALNIYARTKNAYPSYLKTYYKHNLKVVYLHTSVFVVFFVPFLHMFLTNKNRGGTAGTTQFLKKFENY